MSDTLQQSESDPDPVTRLEQANERLAEIDRQIEAHGGEAVVESGADAYREATGLLTSYVDRATGTGRETFKAYIQLEGQFSTLVEQLPAALPHRDAFEAAFEAIDKRRLNESDFARAESALEPAKRLATLIDERDAAEDERTDARRAVLERQNELEAAIEERKRLLELSNADLDAPVETLREPIEAYNSALEEAFDTYLAEQSTRELFALLERSRWHPFVSFERPPEELRTYIETADAGTYTLPELLEYAEYSHSKLSHYVDDADELKRRIATRRTYLERLSGEPLMLSWPPAPATVMQYEIRDRRPLTERVGGQELVDHLRAIVALTRTSSYDRLQTAATAVARLTADERERLATGQVERELETLTDELASVEDALTV